MSTTITLELDPLSDPSQGLQLRAAGNAILAALLSLPAGHAHAIVSEWSIVSARRDRTREKAIADEFGLEYDEAEEPDVRRSRSTGSELQTENKIRPQEAADKATGESSNQEESIQADEPPASETVGESTEYPQLSIDVLDLPLKARNALVKNGIETVEQLTEWTAQDLLELPRIGRLAVDLIKQRLEARGLRLRLPHEKKFMERQNDLPKPEDLEAVDEALLTQPSAQDLPELDEDDDDDGEDEEDDEEALQEAVEAAQEQNGVDAELATKLAELPFRKLLLVMDDREGTAAVAKLLERHGVSYIKEATEEQREAVKAEAIRILAATA